MSPFLETVFRLDGQDDMAGLIALVQHTPPDPQEILVALAQLLTGQRLRTAFLLAMLLANRGYQNPLIALALSVGGLLHHSPEEEKRGLALFATLADSQTSAQQIQIHQQFVLPVLSPLLTNARETGDRDRIPRLLAILQASLPALRATEAQATTAPPIRLSIAIPTYNRQVQLAQALDHLLWTLDAGFPIEIIVSNNASADDTEQVALTKGRRFPHFHYVRQPHTVDGDIHAASVLRLVRGQFFIWMGDDDLLIPEALLAEIAYLSQHETIVASHSSAQMWSTVTNTDCGQVYHIEEPRLFDKTASLELFDFILLHKIFPEWGLYRTDPYLKVLLVPHPSRAYQPLIRTFQALEYGMLRLHGTPFYRVVVQAALKTHDLNQENEGLRQVTTYADQYRGGIEIAAALALTQAGVTELAPAQRGSLLDKVNDFVVGRLSVAARIAQHRGRYIETAEFLQRWLLWAKTDFERRMIREMEPPVLSGAVLQAVLELFAVSVEARQLVLCAVTNPAEIQARLGQMGPDVPLVIRTLPDALAAVDRHECLYVTDQETVRLALQAAGVAVGQIVVRPEWMHLLRITG
ncbi:MAG: glycosyltransferase family 2 protein [Magnetococcales bacterium]|nr:glycosyltransferase family 2 protein [Magnetococcales bacterium]